MQPHGAGTHQAGFGAHCSSISSQHPALALLPRWRSQSIPEAGAEHSPQTLLPPEPCSGVVLSCSVKNPSSVSSLLQREKMYDGSKGCTAMVRPPKHRRLPEISLEKGKKHGAFALCVLTVFFPIKEEGNCLYPARRAEILPSPASESWGFQQGPRGCRVWQAKLSQ